MTQQRQSIQIGDDDEQFIQVVLYTDRFGTEHLDIWVAGLCSGLDADENDQETCA